MNFRRSRAFEACRRKPTQSVVMFLPASGKKLIFKPVSGSVTAILCVASLYLFLFLWLFFLSLIGCTVKFGHSDAVCGNGIMEGDELCDGDDFDGKTCSDYTKYEHGEPLCTVNCKLDLSQCHTCGDGVIEGPEECDGHNLGGATCESLGALEGGELSCKTDCTFDTSDCMGLCGNGIRENEEECDGSDLGGVDCVELGYSPGVLGCLEDCTFDVSGCELLSDCGNGIIEGDEECDDGNNVSGDGCSADCQIEPGWACEDEPSICTPICDMNGDAFQCLSDGRARICQNGEWTDLGFCPMGCDETEHRCHVPSNVPADLMAEGSTTGILSEHDNNSTVHINTDNGEIRNSGGIIRGPDIIGLCPDSSISYFQRSQAGTTVGLGVFVLSELTIGNGVQVMVEGTRGLVLLINGDVNISGVFDLTGNSAQAGAGGFNGGSADTQGHGPCTGLPGQGTSYSASGCGSGSGGGGHGSMGGDGGDNSNQFCTGSNLFPGGSGGGTCGSVTLIPLAGGSGGGGGAILTGVPGSNPGPGGGGGGAIQISSSTSIDFSGQGGINAGGNGGGETNEGGGAGGGGGGAILLEAFTVSLGPNVILAANGGGGGAGDCT